MYCSRSIARLSAWRIWGLAPAPVERVGPNEYEAVDGPRISRPSSEVSNELRLAGGTLYAPSISPSSSAVASVVPSETKT